MTAPWFELGGKVSISCQQSNCSAGITFQTKPFYGGKLHRVTGEIKNPHGQTFCKVQGEWNRTLEFAHTDGSRSETLPVDDLIKRTRAQRLIRPVQQQHSRESRRVWRQVTTALRAGAFEEAEERKSELEGAQRLSPMRSPRIASGRLADANGEHDDHSINPSQPLPEYKSELFEMTESGWLPIGFPGVLDA
uniref:Uncharacterized protein n=1 Tax=Plectus sambesii TaxID=2011161 RepID=A0A914XI37_9BILA